MADKGGMTVRDAGRKGGQTTSRRHGKKFYEDIGHKGGARVRELIEAGKRALDNPHRPSRRSS